MTTYIILYCSFFISAIVGLFVCAILVYQKKKNNKVTEKTSTPFEDTSPCKGDRVCVNYEDQLIVYSNYTSESYVPHIPIPKALGYCKITKSSYYRLQDLYPLALWYIKYVGNNVVPEYLHDIVRNHCINDLSLGDRYKSDGKRTRFNKALSSLRSKLKQQGLIEEWRPNEGEPTLCISPLGFQMLVTYLEESEQICIAD